MLSSQRLCPRSGRRWVAFIASPPEGWVPDRLRVAHDGVEVSLVLEAFRVDLVDVLRAGRPRREPAAASDDLQTADRRIVARGAGQRDRKSTRLNSSHGYISYAVFCLKKKKKKATE